MDWQSRLDALFETASPIDDGEAERALLEQRARELAAVEERQDDPHRPFLTFRTRQGEYAIALRHAREIVAVADCTPVPGLPARLLGLFTLRGAIVPLFDLHATLSGEAASATGGGLAVVLGREQPEIALATDGVGSPLALSEGDLLPSPDLDPALVEGVTVEGVVVLDGAGLLSDPRFFLGSPPP
jgi:purine-binding chemotaxis protein CheW